MERLRMSLAGPFSLLGIGAVLVGGCEGPTGPDPLLEQLPRPLTSVEQQVITRSNQFAFELLRVVEGDERTGNAFISPLSVSMALGMTMNGAVGDTYEEMRSTLGFAGLSQDEINTSYRELIDLLLSLDPRVELGIANSVWYRQEYPFEASFFDVVRQSFDARVEGVDFNDPATVGRINGWVSQETSGRIDEIIDRIDPRDVMYLINAIYFKGSWRNGFDPNRTSDDLFTTASGERVPVRMMNTEGNFRHVATDDYQAIDLPYGNGAFTMTILLPRPGQDLDSLIASLDGPAWQQLVGGMVEGEMMVSLPRFRLEFEKSLVEPLETLGMRIPFGAGAADFSRMSASKGKDLFISDVKHKTYVDVNEEGTEAAAVTAVVIRETSAPPMFRADRPFVFAIRERLSGTVLFAGKIGQPELPG